MRKKGRKRALTNINVILEKTIKGLTLSKKIKVFSLWNEAVGGPISIVAQPYDLKYKTLFVMVKNSVWMQQLRFLEEMIICKINNKLGGKGICKIYFRFGELEQNVGMSKYDNSADIYYATRSKTLIPPSLEDIESVKDSEMRASLERIRMLACKGKTT
jgi:hypothetical protein